MGNNAGGSLVAYLHRGKLLIGGGRMKARRSPGSSRGNKLWSWDHGLLHSWRGCIVRWNNLGGWGEVEQLKVMVENQEWHHKQES